MSKRVLLFRHAKSDRSGDYPDDHSRPLNKRGIRAAQTMGRVLARTCQIPDLVVTSSAVRAKTTIELADEAGAWDCPVRVSDTLYESTLREVLQEIQNLPAEVTSVLLAGHEPTWSMLLSELVGGGRMRVPTAAVACVEHPVDEWSQITPGQGELLWLIPARLFTDGKFSNLQ